MKRRVAVQGMTTAVAPRPQCHDCDWSLGPMRLPEARARLQSHVVAKGHTGSVVTETREIWGPQDA